MATSMVGQVWGEGWHWMGWAGGLEQVGRPSGARGRSVLCSGLWQVEGLKRRTLRCHRALRRLLCQGPEIDHCHWLSTSSSPQAAGCSPQLWS